MSTENVGVKISSAEKSGVSLKAHDSFLARVTGERRAHVAAQREVIDEDELRGAAHTIRAGAVPHRLRAALRADEKQGDANRLKIIAEIKRASPSKGVINERIDVAEIAKAYERGGACAVSVLTEEKYFRGSMDDLRAARRATSLPLLRKDFIVDPVQIYEAAVAGADAILLIVAALNAEELSNLRQVAEDELGMDALIEVHDQSELETALAAGARLVGVNNRDLRTLEVSLTTSLELVASIKKKPIDDTITLISESGLRAAEDFRRLHAAGFQGFLVGETLMRANDPQQTLRALIGAVEMEDQSHGG